MATSYITTYQKNDMSNQNTTGLFSFYKFGNVVFCKTYANGVSTTDVTISGNTYHKVMDIPSGFVPIADAEIRDTLANKRLVFDSQVGIVHAPEGITSTNLRGSITYMSAFDR